MFFFCSLRVGGWAWVEFNVLRWFGLLVWQSKLKKSPFSACNDEFLLLSCFRLGVKFHASSNKDTVDPGEMIRYK